MKNLRINTGFVGIVKKNGDIQKIITAGSYWIGFNTSVEIVDVRTCITNEKLIDQINEIQNENEFLQVITVLDGEIVLRFENEILKGVNTVGRYGYWNSKINFRFIRVNLSEIEIDENISMSVLKTILIAPYVRMVEVEAYEKCLLYKNGTLYRELTGGNYYFWKNSDVLSLKKADLRQLQLEINGQEILTKDKAALRINYNLRYKIVNILNTLVETKDYEKQLYSLCQLALREYIGSLTLDELLANKENVSVYVQAFLKEEALAMGLEIQTSGIKDIILNGDMKEIMNQVLIAEKKAQANIIMRREETASTRSLLNTAKLMEENTMLLKLKEMEYVEKIAERINNISISGGANVIDQMRQLFSTK